MPVRTGWGIIIPGGKENQLPEPCETIVAVATPPGRGGLGIVRLSGPRAIEIGRGLFRPSRPGPLRPWRFRYGWIVDPEGRDLVDEVLAVAMPGPKTYTGEDVFEIQGHGGPVVLRRIVELCLEAGARPAEAGEFTQRAFLAGRIDLAQAEAVAEIVAAQTRAAAGLAAAQLDGRLSRALDEVAGRALEVLARIEAGLDFPEDELGPIGRADLAAGLDGPVIGLLDELIDRGRAGSALRQGVRTVLIGRPNAGKSSLLNALLGRDRALVTESPGTTRDYIEEILEIDGRPVLLTDTAGLRELAGRGEAAEAAGMAATRKLMAEAGLILAVVDASEEAEDWSLPYLPPELREAVLVVANKSDLVEAGRARAAAESLPGRPGLAVSALTGQGLGPLKELIGRLALGQAQPAESALLVNLRQEAALKGARRAFQAARDGLAAGLEAELVALELREGLDQIGRITGRSAPEAVLDLIFARFCVGK